MSVHHYEETAFMTSADRASVRSVLIMAGYTNIRITELKNGYTEVEAIRDPGTRAVPGAGRIRSSGSTMLLGVQ